jgi:hypothetical protein
MAKKLVYACLDEDEQTSRTVVVGDAVKPEG